MQEKIQTLKTTFLYALNDPETGKCRYVGKSDRPKKRLQAHLDKAKLANTHKNCWIIGLRKRGLRPDLEVLDEVPASEWEFWEQEYIRVFRMVGCNLLNALPGGEGLPSGFVFSEKTRENMRKAQTGRRHSEETKEKMRAWSRLNNPMRGRKGQTLAQMAAHEASRGIPKGKWSAAACTAASARAKARWASGVYQNAKFSEGASKAAKNRSRGTNGQFI